MSSAGGWDKILPEMDKVIKGSINLTLFVENLEGKVESRLKIDTQSPMNKTKDFFLKERVAARLAHDNEINSEIDFADKEIIRLLTDFRFWFTDHNFNEWWQRKILIEKPDEPSSEKVLADRKKRLLELKDRITKVRMDFAKKT